MLDQKRLPTTREELFTQRYERLFAWAMQLTNQNRSSAEDLVQDAFIQFTLGRTSLDQISNLDGYLRRMLRYMHLSRLNRDTQHGHDSTLSIIDYDSFQSGWGALDVQHRMQAREDLSRIVQYACLRKETSRAG